MSHEERSQLQEILSISLWIKNPTKRAAREIILHWAATETNDDRWPDLARLLAYFLPPAPARPTTPFDWVAAAVSKHAVAKHPDMECVYCDGQRWLATDSQRAHWAACPEGTLPGLYTHQGEPLGRQTLSSGEGDREQEFWQVVDEFIRQSSGAFREVDLASLVAEEVQTPDGLLTLLAVPSDDRTIWIDQALTRCLPDRRVELAPAKSDQLVYLRHSLGEGLLMAVNRASEVTV